jgi:sulfur-oxidizing protein SoxY
MQDLMIHRRRQVLQGLSALASMGASAWSAAATPTNDATTARSIDDALDALGRPMQANASIVIEMPSVAENGALVPLGVTSPLPGTREIVILVDVNPQPVAARFVIPEGTEAFAATRIRMARSGTVLVAVRTDTGVFFASRNAQVTIGGC